MGKKYNWGILAPGKMSAKFTNALKILSNAELYAVGSRAVERARKFAEEHGFRKYYGSYEELIADPEVEIIYIASPHSFHHEHTLMCLRNGKHVICEKAFALNSHQVDEMISEARKRNLFLMEALWPPFQPFYKKAQEILLSGILGDIIHLHGWFSFQPPYNPDDRKFNPALGAGSLLDIGIYPVIDALTFIGVPDEIKAFALFAPTGSEESLTAIFRYNKGKMADIYSSFRTNEGIGCKLLCENGNMIVSRGRDMNQRVVLELHGKAPEEYIFRPEALGYHWEAEEVMRCLDNGLTESPVVPHSFSIDLIRTLDRIRKEAGVVFPGEQLTNS
ncbi:MAG TPA: Gfo/Idh/MocA family oxidoreductase [Bacteroidales bacterium]|nr:Gfo/Idh/MocA family oxidoreductase [Bacteroidales bacterium]HOK73819.1 Gfo/Idh/MocA family oxidoreductase [Bacteroidales bacterium]HOM40075.1 Gfo/Idh/MocA family oxidoreductase [Bacteroidales bacterium]HOU31128.1 Gfo/Idh/MocA family oxidoreductase [Bacteroidales bacterium]HPP91740.1 Gfo/Idh/MocA family oxidoreductase [Bacteroidales bacterium]